MATSILPTLVAALYDQLTAAMPTVRVYNGFGVTADAGDFLMVGIDDPLTPDAATTATLQQAPATGGTGRSRDETGTLWCSALSWNGTGGDAGQQTALEAAFTIIAAVETLCRTTPDLGITGYAYVVTSVGGSGNFTVRSDQNETGALTWVSFPIAFAARL